MPVLELRASELSCGYLCSEDGIHNEYVPAEAADLPPGFRELWLRTGVLGLGNAGCEPRLGQHVTYVSDTWITTVYDPGVAEELCRFLSSAPDSYREFRLYGGSESPALSVQAQSLPHPTELMKTSTESFDSLEAAAAAMQHFAPAHGLAVSVSDDQTHLLIVRKQAAGQA